MSPPSGALHLGLRPRKASSFDGRDAELTQSHPPEPATAHDVLDRLCAVRHPQPQSGAACAAHRDAQRHPILPRHGFDAPFGVAGTRAVRPGVRAVVEDGEEAVARVVGHVNVGECNTGLWSACGKELRLCVEWCCAGGIGSESKSTLNTLGDCNREPSIIERE